MAAYLSEIWKKITDYSVREVTLDGWESMAPRIDDISNAGRFFLVVYNTSTTISAAYATFIVLAISFALAAIFGLLYYGIASSASGGGFTFGRRKRSNDESDEELERRLLLNILEILGREGLPIGMLNSIQDTDKNDINWCSLQNHLCKVFSDTNIILEEQLKSTLLAAGKLRDIGNTELKLLVDAAKMGQEFENESLCEANFGGGLKCEKG